ncbi:MAG: hypothetical protein AB1641_11795 [Thermodesulfobacteriota bacterium]
MPRKKTVNTEKLFKAIEQGTPAKEIMNKFQIKTSAQLKALYLDALVAQGQVKGIAGRTGGGPAAKKAKNIMVNKRGSLVITREMVEEFGFKTEDVFSIRKTKAGVSLKKA